MDEIEEALRAAWKVVRPRLLGDPAELARRLARREGKHLSKVPRAWCLAVRAVDRRINEANAIIIPPSAMEPRWNRTGRYERHEVVLDSRLLEHVCRAVTLDAPGQTRGEVAQKLGTTPQGLVDARIKGTFRVHHIKGLGGARGLVPLLYTDKQLDPCVRGFEMPDEAWSWTTTLCRDRIPGGIEQKVVRVPAYLDRTRQFRDKEGLHPEHPDVDVAARKRARKPKRLPPPEPDYLGFYKWKDGVYLGYDWRNPYMQALHEKTEKRKKRVREWARRYYASKRTCQGSGSLRFVGWRWICPKCERVAAMLYYPLPPQNLLADERGCVGVEQIDSRRRGRGCVGVEQIDSRRREGPWRSEFACVRCHRVTAPSRADSCFWNDLVAYLSDGLLYGSEVKRPAWLTKRRKRAYAPRPGAQLPWRREQVREVLLLGWPYKRIAAKLGIHWHTVDCHARKLYRQYGAHGRYDLAKNLGAALVKPVTKGQRVAELVARGLRNFQICRELGMKKNEVAAYVSELRRKDARCEETAIG